MVFFCVQGYRILKGTGVALHGDVQEAVEDVLDPVRDYLNLAADGGIKNAEVGIAAVLERYGRAKTVSTSNWVAVGRLLSQQAASVRGCPVI